VQFQSAGFYEAQETFTGTRKSYHTLAVTVEIIFENWFPSTTLKARNGQVLGQFWTNDHCMCYLNVPDWLRGSNQILISWYRRRWWWSRRRSWKKPARDTRRWWPSTSKSSE
jgi:hypothetical protein